MGKRRVVLIGSANHGSLERSYLAAALQTGDDAVLYDLGSARRSVFPVPHRLLDFADHVQHYLNVERYRTAFAKLVFDQVRALEPTHLLLFGRSTLEPGILAQLRTALDVRTAWYWADPMTNLHEPALTVARLVDVVASYSAAAAPVFERLGAARVVWVPFAIDPSLHSGNARNEADKDVEVSFIGAWRPERQDMLSPLVPLGLRIWGTSWRERLPRRHPLRRCFTGETAVGEEFSRVVGRSKVSINIVDRANYPGANMRLFELSGLGACQVATACPEMEGVLQDGVHLRYVRSTTALTTTVQELLRNPEYRASIGAAAREAAMEAHTYDVRYRSLIEALDGGVQRLH